jgi:hypothetical protein
MDGWSRIPPIEPGQTVREFGDFVPVMLARRVPSSFLRMQSLDDIETGVTKGADDAGC